MLVLASHGLKQKEIDKVAPYELEGLLNYDSRYILGHEAEVYQMDLQEGYKVADAIAEIGAGGSSFSDWWAYKFEVYDAIPHNGALLHRAQLVLELGIL